MKTQATRIVRNPIYCLCPTCSGTKMKQVWEHEIEYSNRERKIEIPVCPRCEETMYPVFPLPFRTLHPESEYKLIFDEDEECYYAIPANKEFLLNMPFECLKIIKSLFQSR